MIKRHWLGVVLVISWAYFLGNLASKFQPDSQMFEVAGVICGGSLGLWACPSIC